VAFTPRIVWHGKAPALAGKPQADAPDADVLFDPITGFDVIDGIQHLTAIVLSKTFGAATPPAELLAYAFDPDAFTLPASFDVAYLEQVTPAAVGRAAVGGEAGPVSVAVPGLKGGKDYDFVLVAR
jgi:hypothetical protein